MGILTAVVSDNMKSVTEESEKGNQEESEKSEKDIRRETLSEIFEKLDADHSGDLSARHFTRVLEDEELSNELVHVSRMSREELMDIFHVLARKCGEERQPKVSREDFLQGLENGFQASLIRLEKRIANMDKEFSFRMDNLEVAVLKPQGPSAR